MSESTGSQSSNTKAPPEKMLNGEGAISWHPPSMTVKGKVIQSAWKEKKREVCKEKIEVVSKASRPRTLTVEELTKISEEAKKEAYDLGYEEGLQAGKTDGYNAGFEEGNKKAYQQTRAQIEEEKSRLCSISNELLFPMQNQQQDIENIVVDMAVHLAQKLLQSEITFDPSKLFHIVKKAINALPVGSNALTIYLHEEDEALLKSLYESDAKTYAQIESWKIKTDTTMSRGGCTVESNESVVNYDIKQRLDTYFEQVHQTPNSAKPQQQDKLIERPDEKNINAHDALTDKKIDDGKADLDTKISPKSNLPKDSEGLLNTDDNTKKISQDVTDNHQNIGNEPIDEDIPSSQIENKATDPLQTQTGMHENDNALEPHLNANEFLPDE